MRSTFYRWLGLTKLSKSQILMFIGLTLGEVLCYLFLPISYANIATKATSQNIQLAILWAGINFMTQLLNIILASLKSSLLSKTKESILNLLNQKITDNNKNYLQSTLKNISEYIISINSFLVLTFKLISIIIVAGIYSLYLMIYLLIAIFICLLISAILEYRKKLNMTETSSKSLIIDSIWTIFTFIITLIIIDLINEQKITLTIFLLLSTFINTHLVKPNFDLSFIHKTRQLSSDLDTYIKFSKLK